MRWDSDAEVYKKVLVVGETQNVATGFYSKEMPDSPGDVNIFSSKTNSLPAAMKLPLKRIGYSNTESYAHDVSGEEPDVCPPPSGKHSCLTKTPAVL